jgi:hypothetical protein
MSRSVIGAVLAALIAVLTVTAYLVTTAKLESDIYKDTKQRVAKSQELLIQNSSLEMLRLLKHAEAMALDPQLREALGGDEEGATPNPVLAEDVFKKFRAGLSADEAQPDIMAMTDDQGHLIALMSGGNPVTSPVRDTYLDGDKIKYPALQASIQNQITTSEIWHYEGSGAMKVTVAPILGDGVNTTLGTVLVAYSITSPEAKKQHELLGAHVVYFFGKQIHATSFGSAKEQQEELGKSLFQEGGLAEQALTSKKGLGEIEKISYKGNDYLATTGRLQRYSSKALATDYPAPEAGAMVLISLSEATSSVGIAGVTILLVGLFGIFMVFVAISLTSKRILHPLEEIEIGVNDIINGNLDRTFEPVGSDLDGLANALNVMLARLLGRPEPGEEEFDEEGNIIRNEVQLPRIHQSGAIDLRQAEAEALAAEPVGVYLKRIHDEFVAAQAANGETAASNYDDFVKKLQDNEGALKQKYGAREVRFKVVNEGGKVTLKPLPIM